MKTMKTKLLIAVLTILSSAVFASGNLKVNISQAESKKATVEATNVETEYYEIEVKTEFGERIFKKETEAKADYKRKYDFSRLEDGIYFLSVKHGKALTQKRFELESGEVTVLDERKVLEPFFTQDGSTVNMSYLNFPKDDLSIYVYDDDKLLLEEKLSNDFSISKAINLSELNSGNYRIVLASGFDTFEHNVAVE